MNITDETREKERVLALFKPILYPRISKNETKSLDEMGITIWQDYHNYKEMRQFGTIILSPLSSQVITNDNAVMEKEILRLLEEGGHVCILCDTALKEDLLVGKILLMVYCRLVGISSTVSELSILQSEFTEFLKNFGTISNFFVANYNLDKVICTTSYILLNSELQNEISKFGNEAIVGFTIKKEKGLVTVLPFHLSSSHHGDDLASAIIQLSKALDTHRKNLIFQPPTWINSIKLSKEKEIEIQLSNLNEKVQENQNILADQFKFKSILWLKHDELDEECRNVLNVMGLATRKKDIREDFWYFKKCNSKLR